jgi:uncharacterized protein YcbX
VAEPAGTVEQLWRFPVKSLQGTPVDALTFDERGAAGDRQWAIVDPAAGKVLSAKRWPDLLLASAAIDGSGTVVLTLPDGSTHEAGDPATDAAVSVWLDHPVRVQQPPPGDGLPYDVYTDNTDDDSDLWEFPGPPGGPFVDLAAAHLLTTASLRAASALAPSSQWDVRRFRPSAVLDVDGDSFAEDDWVGAEVALGAELTLAPFMRTPRCSLPTRAQPGLDRDKAIARSLTDGHGNDLGVYAAVARPGTVRIGDAVTLSRQ